MIPYDLRQGLLRRWKLFLLPALVFGFGAVSALREMAWMDMTPTLGLLLLQLLQGCYPHVPNTTFTLPETWFAVVAGAMLMTLFYPASCMEGAGTQILIRAGSRRRWWYSKCLWNVLSTALYFAVGVAVLALLCLLCGGRADLTGTEALGWVVAESAAPGTIVWNMLLVPVVTLTALSLGQMLIAVRWNQISGFLLSMTVLLYSAVVQSPLAIGNYTMALRCAALTGEGLDFTVGAALAAAICLFCVLGGGEIFRRQDVLNAKNKGE